MAAITDHVERVATTVPRYIRRVEPLTRPVVRFWRKAYQENLTGLASMVAYSLLLSIFPLCLIALFIASRVVSSPELAQSVLEDAKSIFPQAADSTLSEGVRRLQQSSATTGILALVSSLWVGASFWGALDTAFCQIYHLPCRTWIRQKLFGFMMLGVVLLFIIASVAVPTMQALLSSASHDLPLGLGDVDRILYWVTIGIGLLVLFGALCITYSAVPKGKIPWACVWPGALGATVAMGVVDYAFPLYLSNVSTLRIGTSAVFVLIALVWFYLLALILLSGAVVNELRFESLAEEKRGNARLAGTERDHGSAAAAGAGSDVVENRG